MEGLSSCSILGQMGPQACGILRPRLVFTGSFRFPSARNERPLLCSSTAVFGSFSCHSGIVLPISAATEVDVSKVVPQADRVLIKLEELPQQSTGGVLLPKAAVKFEQYLCGEVLSVGKEASGVTIGQKVLFLDFNSYEVNFGTKERLCFCKAGDLLALVE